jgi:predicted transcriptional regulator of viral defense system
LIITAYERYLLVDYRHIRHWVDDLPRMGRASFSLADAKAQFPEMSEAGIRSALHRLAAAGKVCSIWRGFYAVVLPDYGLSGDVPPVEYIGQLMAYVQADYYIALLSAASYQGASHQSPQVFQVIADKQLRSKVESGVRIEFAYKRRVPEGGIEQKAARSGLVNVSAPLLTALDLVTYQRRSGGISNVASVLAGLAESIDLGDGAEGVVKGEPSASVQRLGHILESVLGEDGLADGLLELCSRVDLRFGRVDLVPGLDGRPSSYDGKWKVSVNYDVEVDD